MTLTQPQPIYQVDLDQRRAEITHGKVRPGFYILSGNHWLTIQLGFGCEWITTAGPDCATLLETHEEADWMLTRICSRGVHPRYEIHEVTETLEVDLMCESCNRQEGTHYTNTRNSRFVCCDCADAGNEKVNGQ